MQVRVGKFGNSLFSALAGIAAFIFTLLAFLLLRELDQQIAASFLIGLCALLVVWIAAERPNSGHARAISALIDRLMAVKSGDLTSPAPPAVHQAMPALASAVDDLFAQVRSNLDTVNLAAMYDPITSLPNRTHFKQTAETLLAAQSTGAISALLFIDLDGFKEVNDRLGHARGDQVLVLVANRLRVMLKNELTPPDVPRPLLARLAGDEFTLFLPAVASAEDGRAIAGRALAALSHAYEVDGHVVNMSASIGVASCPDHGCDLAALMKAADIAMYHAKASGGARVCVYEAQLAADSEEKARMDELLREAFQRGEFEVAYLPQLCARSGRPSGAKAIVRWNRPGGAQALPRALVSAAQQSSLIVELGEWFLQHAAQSLAGWKAAGIDQRMTFLAGSRQIERPDAFARFRELLSRSGRPPWMMELELSEATLMQCSEQTIAELAALHDEGVSVAIAASDSGLLSLARMRKMPVDRIKLDPSLIEDVDTSADARTILSALIHFIHSLGWEAVAEDVERAEQADVLRAIGCDSIQRQSGTGPLADKEFLAWVASQEAPRSAARMMRA